MKSIRLAAASVLVASFGVLPAALAAESDPVDLGGSPVEGGTASSPTEVKAGVWSDTLDAGEDAHHFSYRRTTNFSVVHVGVVATTDQDLDSLSLNTTVGEDTTCGENNASPAEPNITFGTQIDFEGAGPEDRNDECLTADVVHFSVEHTGEDADMPFALTVVEERPTEPGSTVDLPAATETVPDYSAPEVEGSSEDVTGATSFGEAPSLEDGTWSDTIQSGEELLYSIDQVDWGQSLSVRVTSPELSAEQAEKAGYSVPGLTAVVHGPLRNPLDDAPDDATTSTSLSEEEGATITTAAGPIRYLNRYETSSLSAIPGRHWISIRMTGPGEGQPIEVPVDIEVDVQGEPSGVPSYGEDDAPFLISEGEWAPTVSDAGTGLSVVRMVASAVLGVGGAACIAVGTLRLRRRSPGPA